MGEQNVVYLLSICLKTGEPVSRSKKNNRNLRCDNGKVSGDRGVADKGEDDQ